MARGKILKFSGEKRMASMHPPSHPEHVKLSAPPPPNSPYYRYGEKIARLEIVDGLLDFAYAMWAKDVSVGPSRTGSADRWNSMENYSSWCRQKWTTGNDTREHAILGLMYVVAFSSL